MKFSKFSKLITGHADTLSPEVIRRMLADIANATPDVQRAALTCGLLNHASINALTQAETPDVRLAARRAIAEHQEQSTLCAWLEDTVHADICSAITAETLWEEFDNLQLEAKECVLENAELSADLIQRLLFREYDANPGVLNSYRWEWIVTHLAHHTALRMLLNPKSPTQISRIILFKHAFDCAELNQLTQILEPRLFGVLDKNHNLTPEQVQTLMNRGDYFIRFRLAEKHAHRLPPEILTKVAVEKRRMDGVKRHALPSLLPAILGHLNAAQLREVYYATERCSCKTARAIIDAHPPTDVLREIMFGSALPVRNPRRLQMRIIESGQLSRGELVLFAHTHASWEVREHALRAADLTPDELWNMYVAACEEPNSTQFRAVVVRVGLPAWGTEELAEVAHDENKSIRETQSQLALPER